MTSPRVAVLDYGSGNLRSAVRAVERAGAEAELTSDASTAIEADGLLVPGVVERLQAPIVPHMGWNTVEPGEGSRMFAGIEDERFYFVHSYGVRDWVLSQPPAMPDPAVTWTDYAGDRFVSAAEHGPLWATQFHPEKSGDAGSQLLKNWLATL